ncbi:hypothetical protein MTAT_19220 [Moorella thermoacetica]|uniref:Uncharacterized protein n=1 Tax=Neomoorella thermoacetica TaxID=1525 RepID=A0AAC9HIR6_NEOTH|nr:hypothetical protein [Moorella thermoacetica]AOQ24579.1 hypothetical protein Maut_02149 [Moorella thermoacetica]TYL12680.1 hypothetical protein MTAT_19220 [Moorella thermoacetica]
MRNEELVETLRYILYHTNSVFSDLTYHIAYAQSEIKRLTEILDAVLNDMQEVDNIGYR